MNRPTDPPPPFSPPPPDERGPSFEVVWRVEDDDPATWDLPARFQLVRDLGDGPFGPLFAVRDAQRTARVARLEVVSRSRTLPPAERDALQARLAAAARVGAPTLTPTLEIGRLPDGRVFALCEHVEGETLVARLAREGALHPAHALEVARQVLAGLSALHGAGLAHGDVRAGAVWLAHNVEKHDTNPYGVRACLLGAGVAAPGADGVRDDLRGLGETLAALSGPLAVGSEISEAAHALARDLVEGTSSRASSASRARASIEQILAGASARALSALERRNRRLVYAAAVAGCLALGWLSWSARSQAAAAVRAAELERDNFARAQRVALEMLGSLRAELAAGETHMTGQLDALEAALLRDDARAAREPSASVELPRELAAQRNLAQRLQLELDQRGAALEALRGELATALARSDRSVRAARGLDALLALLTSGAGELARERALALEAEGLYGASEHLSLLAQALAAARRFEASRAQADGAELDIAACDEALRAFERAQEQRIAFMAEATPWLELQLNDAPPGARGERLASAYELLHQRVRAARAERELAHERDLFALRSAPEHSSGAPAFAHAARFGCGHLEEFGERFVRELRERVAAGPGIEPQALRAASSLPSWAERARNGDVRLSAEQARDLELLDAARRWCTGEPLLDAQLALVRAADGFDRGGTWRSQLALQVALAEAFERAPRLGEELWRCDLDPSGRREWWRERVERADGRRQIVRRSRFDAVDGVLLGEGLLHLERGDAQARFVGSRTLLVDLRGGGAALSVGALPPPEPVELPPRAALERHELEDLRDAGAGELCLVWREGDVVRWYTPRLGLVREETRLAQGVALTQLIARGR